MEKIEVSMTRRDEIREFIRRQSRLKIKLKSVCIFFKVVMAIFLILFLPFMLAGIATSYELHDIKIVLVILFIGILCILIYICLGRFIEDINFRIFDQEFRNPLICYVGKAEEFIVREEEGIEIVFGRFISKKKKNYIYYVDNGKMCKTEYFIGDTLKKIKSGLDEDIAIIKAENIDFAIALSLLGRTREELSNDGYMEVIKKLSDKDYSKVNGIKHFIYPPNNYKGQNIISDKYYNRMGRHVNNLYASDKDANSENHICLSFREKKEVIYCILKKEVLFNIKKRNQKMQYYGVNEIDSDVVSKDSIKYFAVRRKTHILCRYKGEYINSWRIYRRTLSRLIKNKDDELVIIDCAGMYYCIALSYIKKAGDK